MNIGIVIQARMGSTRLPRKVMMSVTPHMTVLDWVVARIRQNEVCSKIILATTTLSLDDALAEYAISKELLLYRGSEEDVLERYLGAAEIFELDALARITADCPLIEPVLIDAVIQKGLLGVADYVSTEGYPRGCGDIEFVTRKALQRAAEASHNTVYYREHVTLYISDHPNDFEIEMLTPEAALHRPQLRLCVDEMADLELVRHVCAYFAPRKDFTVADILGYLDAAPDIAVLNQQVQQKTHKA